MKKSARLVVAGSILAFVASFFALLHPSPAFAQPDPDTIGVFADAVGTVTTLDFIGGETTFYVVAFDPQPFDGYEFSIDMPSHFVVINTNWLSAEGTEATVSGDIRNAQVAAGGCIDGSGANVLADVTIATFSSVGLDVPICLGPSDPTRFRGDPGPAYETCADGLVRFHPVSNSCQFLFPTDPRAPGCLVLNSTGGVPLDNPTFSEIKARY